MGRLHTGTIKKTTISYFKVFQIKIIGSPLSTLQVPYLQSKITISPGHRGKQRTTIL